jgi:hypothetical protein
MLKKVLIILIGVMFLCPLNAFCEEDWSDYNNIDNAWDGQKTITNKQFEETMNALQAKKKQKENKRREKAIKKFKGSSLIPQMDAHNDSMVNEQPNETLDECQLVNIPADFVVDGKLVDRGYYRILGEKRDDGVYILLYQAHALKARIKARETNDDFNEQGILFARLLYVDDTRMKIIYGSVDFNAYAYVSIIQPEPLF